MSAPKFTPGPWSRGGVSLHTGAQHVIAGKLVIADVHSGVSGLDPALAAQDANARLIAAAPDLYEALNAVFHAKIIYVGGGPEESIAECGMGGDLEIVRQMIAAALLKAEGQQ